MSHLRLESDRGIFMGPAGHSLAGAGCYLGYCLIRRHPVRPAGMLAAVVLANLPDLDLLGAFWLGFPKANIYHHSFTHTIAFALGIGILTAMINALFTQKRTFIPAVPASIYVLSHVICDYFTRDTGFPYGEMIIWPVSSAYSIGPSIFLDISKASWQNLFSMNNLKATIHELLVFSPPVSFMISFLLIRSLRSGEETPNESS